jgi:hypothetical protein
MSSKKTPGIDYGAACRIEVLINVIATRLFARHLRGRCNPAI